MLHQQGFEKKKIYKEFQNEAYLNGSHVHGTYSCAASSYHCPYTIKWYWIINYC